MAHFRISEAARLIGVSDDTIRRWAADGLLEADTDESGRRVITGASLARRALELAPASDAPSSGKRTSARNRFTGIVTSVQREGLIGQVELQSGPNRVVSLMTREAVDDLDLQVGDRATAVVKATTVIIETEKSA